MASLVHFRILLEIISADVIAAFGYFFSNGYLLLS